MEHRFTHRCAACGDPVRQPVSDRERDSALWVGLAGDQLHPDGSPHGPLVALDARYAWGECRWCGQQVENRGSDGLWFSVNGYCWCPGHVHQHDALPGTVKRMAPAQPSGVIELPSQALVAWQGGLVLSQAQLAEFFSGLTAALTPAVLPPAPEPARVLPAAPVPEGVNITPRRRVGDAERNEVIDKIGTAHATGHIGADEMQARITAAVAAETREQLDVLVTDLPKPAPEEPPGRRGLAVTPANAAWTAVACLLFYAFGVVRLAVEVGAGALAVLIPVLAVLLPLTFSGYSLTRKRRRGRRP